jgi:alkylation response protein AidB-like acyl-CoA dehydrogenase
MAACLIEVQQILFSAANQCAMAKLAGSSLAGDAARDAIQAFAGYGFVKELAATGEGFRLEAIYRDSRIGEIHEGAKNSAPSGGALDLWPRRFGLTLNFPGCANHWSAA